MYQSFIFFLIITYKYIFLDIVFKDCRIVWIIKYNRKLLIGATGLYSKAILHTGLIPILRHFSLTVYIEKTKNKTTDVNSCKDTVFQYFTVCLDRFSLFSFPQIIYVEIFFRKLKRSRQIFM